MPRSWTARCPPYPRQTELGKGRGRCRSPRPITSSQQSVGVVAPSPQQFLEWPGIRGLFRHEGVYEGVYEVRVPDLQ
jgi:hypothetical protein